MFLILLQNVCFYAHKARSEESWNKHMAMIMLAQIFLNEAKYIAMPVSYIRWIFEEAGIWVF